MSILFRHTKQLLLPLLIFGGLALMMAMKPAPDALQRVKARGELVVVTRTSPTTYYRDQHGATGMEYELARGLADRLGVKLHIITRDSIGGLLKAVENGQADLAAAGLTITKARSQKVRFSTPYQHITEKLVYRMGEQRPDSLSDLAGKTIAVLADSSHAEHLKALRDKYGFQVREVDSASPEKLLALINGGKYDYTVVDSNAFKVNRSLFPKLAAGFDIGDRQPLAWAFSRNDDKSLFLAAQRYLTQRKADGTVAALKNRFYGQNRQFNYVAAQSFLQHLEKRLPRYIDNFRQAAHAYHIDWRLLAAMGYQESLWNEDAVSPTGVRGLMMLTRRTARAMGVNDRTDAGESIRAGAAYLRKLLDEMPQDVKEPDRTWMAVAAYNVGMGHLEDARKITEYEGGNPDSWQDVRKRLPLLKKPSYYRYTRHGYARSGGQAVVYVSHIRHYYDLLVWAGGAEQQGDQTLLAMAD